MICSPCGQGEHQNCPTKRSNPVAGAVHDQQKTQCPCQHRKGKK